jgi:hypothetical protein
MVEPRNPHVNTKQTLAHQSKSVAPFPSVADVRVWAAELEEVAAPLAPRFERAEPRQRVLRYLTGLLSATERKNGGSSPNSPGRRRQTACSACSARRTGTRRRCATT